MDDKLRDYCDRHLAEIRDCKRLGFKPYSTLVLGIVFGAMEYCKKMGRPFSYEELKELLMKDEDNIK